MELDLPSPLARLTVDDRVRDGEITLPKYVVQSAVTVLRLLIILHPRHEIIF